MTNSVQELLQALNHSPVITSTDTVFGLCAHATESGVQQLYTLKKRDPSKPFVLIVHSLEQAKALVHIPSHLEPFLQSMWPGPLTFVGQSRSEQYSTMLSTPTLGVRIPRHTLLLQTLETLQKPLLLTSANLSGQFSITEASQRPQALHSLPCLQAQEFSYGIESTVTRWIDTSWQILRYGATPLETFLQHGYAVTCIQEAIESPLCQMHTTPQQHEHFLGFGQTYADPAFNLSPSGHALEACQKVYNLLHKLQNASHIGVAPLPDEGLGQSLYQTLAHLRAR